VKTTPHPFPLAFALISLLASCSTPPPRSPAAAPVGIFDGHGDIGSPKIAGSASYDAAKDEYTLAAGGINMWTTSDQFQFAWKKLRGDFILRARVEFIGQGTDPHRKLGWAVRPNLTDADAPYMDVVEHGDGRTSLQYRRTKGAITEEILSTLTKADVIQLERKGGLYTFSAARFGETFVTSELKDLDLGDEIYAGLFLCSHNADVKEQAIFRDVQIIRPVKPGFTPYRDFIGSVLHTLDVTTGKLETLYRDKVPFEAPNWTTDGRALIYNVSGRAAGWGSLQRFDLATRTPAPLDFGIASVTNNNDHVLSFDGKMLGISHQNAGSPRNQSAVFTAPAGGGTPRLITPNTPSYFHGWSPDGMWLLFAGGRKDPPGSAGADKYDIYKIASDGSGEEIRLTGAKGRSDGPEFTPDGQWIYFNSTRADDPAVADPKQLMQLWRMRPDGSGQERVMKDDFNNWFPHISPDGKWIAFISFPPDVSPEDHPYYRHCYIRLMPIAGGPAKVVAYVYGGQGTINVPSWSPDSRKIAFVSNTDLN
jgi:Tol biopolymer transport system component